MVTCIMETACFSHKDMQLNMNVNIDLFLFYFWLHKPNSSHRWSHRSVLCKFTNSTLKPAEIGHI